jgi:PTH1 family peptidyl-tRNA hydrolase
MYLVVGLGNPGSQYAQTRHNVGWEAVDALAHRLGWTRSRDDFNRIARTRFEGLTLDGPLGEEKLLLLKPTTLMNLSGQSVQAAVNFYQVPLSQMLVVLDDLALPCGRLRFRGGGSNGGHNGLRDIERALGTTQYPRLRIGIDEPPGPIRGRDYVLGRFTPEQRKLIDPAVDRAASAMLTWIERGLEQAMSQYNAPEKAKDTI